MYLCTVTSIFFFNPNTTQTLINGTFEMPSVDRDLCRPFMSGIAISGQHVSTFGKSKAGSKSSGDLLWQCMLSICAEVFRNAGFQPKYPEDIYFFKLTLYFHCFQTYLIVWVLACRGSNCDTVNALLIEASLVPSHNHDQDTDS